MKKSSSFSFSSSSSKKRKLSELEGIDEIEEIEETDEIEEIGKVKASVFHSLKCKRLKMVEANLGPKLESIYPYELSHEEQEEFLFTCFDREQKYKIDIKKFQSQSCSVTFNNRSETIDWIFEVGRDYSLQKETCHLAALLLDQVLYMNPTFCKINNFQLIASTCIHIACKIEVCNFLFFFFLF
jgi:hypothetical protein